ncbi:MAG: tyrosine-type recombinase/integrase [Candidatus Aquicultor sp.]
MLGSVQKKGDRWYCVYTDPITKKQKWVSAETTKRMEAEKKLKEIIRAIDDNTYTPPTKQTFKDFTDNTWLGEYIASRKLKPSTVVSYSMIAREHLIPFFGAQRVEKVTPAMVLRYKANLIKEGRLSNRTIQYHLVVLSNIFKAACVLNILRSNPCANIEKPSIENHEPQTLSIPELRGLVDNAEGVFKVFLMIAVTTGMRLSEIRALKWSDIDFKENIVSIERNLYKGQVCLPKNNKTREAPMVDDLKAALLEYEKNAPTSGDGWLFPLEDGNPVDADRITRWFRNAVKAAKDKGIIPSDKKITFHNLRHTFCSISAVVNENQFITQKLAGHSNISTTAKYYVKLERDAKQKAASKVSDSIFKVKHLGEKHGIDSEIYLNAKRELSERRGF